MKLIYKKVEFDKQKLKAIVVDNVAGAYFNIAIELRRWFDVYYHTIDQSEFPTPVSRYIGTGYDGITRVNDFWSSVNDYDVFIFPDIYFKHYGNHLRSLGKMVWGGNQSEDIETSRSLFKDSLQSVGLPIANTQYLTGLSNLESFMKKNSDVWIKISYFRGLAETFHHIDMNQSMMWLNNIKSQLGPLAETQEFVIEDPIDVIAEVGYDGYTINGMMPNTQMWGVETKDSSYLGTWKKKEDMPSSVIDVNDKFGPILQKYKHTGFYSNEIRVGKDGKDYYTDPTMRAGSPPSNVYLNMISNWGDIIVSGCNGTLVEPTFTSKYGVELILKSNYCFSNFMPITIDPKYRANLKLKSSLNVDGVDYIVPGDQVGGVEMEEFGSLVFVGDDIDNLFNQCLEAAKTISCFGLSYDKDALNNSKKGIEDITKTLNVTF